MSRIELTDKELCAFQQQGREAERHWAVTKVNGNDLEGLATELLTARRTLATLAAAGITTGEDGEPRFHGLTGAEIEGMRGAAQAFVNAAHTIREQAKADGSEFAAQQVEQHRAWIAAALAAAPSPASEGAEGGN